MTNPSFMMIGSVLVGLAVATGVFAARQTFVGLLDRIEHDLAGKMKRLRMSTRNLRRWLIGWLFALIGAAAALWLVLDSLIFALLAAVLLAVLPWYVLSRFAERHRQKIEDQLADAMVSLANAVRAGLSLAQALEILAAQCPRPINAEFQQIVAEYNLGKPLDRTLDEAKERLRSENFALFAAALMASHESGGRLNETVERIARSVLELQRLERKVAAETAQARKSAVYMAIAPAFILAVYFFIDPANTTLLFTNVVGQLILAVAVVLNIIAYLWARVILNPDI